MNILCANCERIFGVWDDYAQKILGENLVGGRTLFNGINNAGYVIENYNYELLKLFFISLLWRASVSTHPFYKRINLGPFENKAKDMLTKRDAGSEEVFAVHLAYFEHFLEKGILDPHPEKIESGINYNRFYLGKYVVYIKTDNRSTPNAFSKFQIAPHRPLVLIKRNLDKSKELPLFYEIVSSTKN